MKADPQGCLKINFKFIITNSQNTNKLASYFLTDFRQPVQSLWFKRALCLFLAVKCVYWLAHYDLLFGENAIAYIRDFDNGWLTDSAYILYGQKDPGAGLCFIIPVMVICIAQLFKIRFYFAGDLILWFLVVNVHNKIYPTLTAGEFLLNQLLFFNIFISQNYNKYDTKFSALRLASHNFAVLAVMIQVCFVYFFSALAKWQDADWQNGSAVLLTSQAQHYSLYGLVRNAENMSILFIFLNYFVLAYQSLFPALIWLPKIKKPFLIIGILMHLYIAFVMGLISFGFIMILAYIFFWPLSKSDIG